MAKPEQKFLLSVSYPADRHPGFGLDSTIRGIVGRPETGAGTDLKSMTRDMSFEFDDKGDAKKALSRLKKKKIEAEVRPS